MEQHEPLERLERELPEKLKKLERLGMFLLLLFLRPPPEKLEKLERLEKSLFLVLQPLRWACLAS
jgi:hypothetical protein